MKKFSLRLPKTFERFATKLKYVFLGVIVLGSVLKGSVIVNGSPFKDIFNFSISAMSLIWVVASVFIYRPFCRFLCPYGALMSLVDLLPVKIFKISKSPKCTDCKLCERICPSYKECFMCGECLKVCKLNAIEYTKHYRFDEYIPK